MTQLDYISCILNKMRHKKYECYVLSRFWHRLDDLTIEISPQQYIARENGFALADLYLPQFNLVIEVDESHHMSLKNLSADQVREKDIIKATNAEIYRIPIYSIDHDSERIKQKSIDEVNHIIEDLVHYVKSRKNSMQDFKAWDMNKKHDTDYYIQKGNINLEDGCAFRRIVDALNCFGKQYNGWQRGGAKHSQEVGKLIWFPKLYVNNEWQNSLNIEEDIIVEKAIDVIKRAEHVDKHLADNVDYRVVFAHGKNVLGETLYRFKGEFELNRNQSNHRDGLIWERVSSQVKTYNREYKVYDQHS
ncbi:MAG: AbaSI family restriction endonuclease [Wohlfahrtiimonas sp.]